jgi:hypothetical protein
MNFTASLLKTALKMRPFQRYDWNGWAGAEPFKDGTSPYIGEVSFGGDDGGVIIADKNGIGFYLMWEPMKEDNPEPDESKVDDRMYNVRCDGQVELEGQDKDTILNQAERVLQIIQRAGQQGTSISQQKASVMKALEPFHAVMY